MYTPTNVYGQNLKVLGPQPSGLDILRSMHPVAPWKDIFADSIPVALIMHGILLCSSSIGHSPQRATLPQLWAGVNRKWSGELNGLYL